MSLREQINQNRSKIQRDMQAIYAKHGITVEGVSTTGATLRFTKGSDSLFDAAVEEAEYLAGLVPGGTVEATEPETEDDEIEEVESDDDEIAVMPPPPGANAGKWTGKWTRIFRGVFTENE